MTPLRLLVVVALAVGAAGIFHAIVDVDDTPWFLAALALCAIASEVGRR